MVRLRLFTSYDAAIELFTITYEVSNKRNDDKPEAADVSRETDRYAAQLRRVKFTSEWIYN